MEVQYHPVANLFPLIEGQAFEDLANDIEIHGLVHPVWYVTEGGVRLIVDGRNRYRACQARGVVVRWQEWRGAGSLVQWVMSENLHRRHLKESQRAMLAARAVGFMEAEEEAAEKLNLSANLRDNSPRKPGRPPQPKTSAKAAKAASVSTRSVTNAKKVMSKGTAKLQEAVVAGKISVSKASRIADMTEAEQIEEIRRQGEQARKTVATMDAKDLLDRLEQRIARELRQAEQGGATETAFQLRRAIEVGLPADRRRMLA